MSDTLTFKQSMQRIEEILSLLERNEIELEEAIEIFEEGLKLIQSCDTQLKGFEERIESLVTTYQGDNNE